MDRTYKVEGMTSQKFGELCVRQVIDKRPSSGDVTEVVGT